MTDKERLEIIKDKQLYMHSLSTFDISWLIEQAERVQELEESNKRNYWIGTEFKFENLKLEQQSKRLREALKFYADEENYVKEEFVPLNPRAKSIMMSSVDWDDGEKAREALEGFKKC